MSTPTRRQLEKNFRRVLALAFFQVFLVLMPIIVLFFESRGLTLPEIFLLQAWFAAVVLVMEAPSGYLADLLGRKRVIVTGTFFLGVGQSVLLFAEGFWQLALFESCLGLGLSLMSGADLALLYDTELALKGHAHGSRKAVRRLFTTRDVSEALAAATCSVLLIWSMETAVYVQVASGWMAFLLAFGLVEPPGNRMSRDSHIGNIGTVLRHLLMNGAVLRLTFLAMSVWALTTMFAVWLLQKHWQQLGIGIVHYGYLWAALTFVSAAAGRYALSLENRFGSTAMLVIVGIGPVLGYLALGTLGAVGGVLVSVVFFACRGFGHVVLSDALNKRVPSEFRATANSFASLGFRAAFALTAPLVAAALNLWGMETTFLVLGGMSLVIFGTLVVPLIGAARRAQDIGDQAAETWDQSVSSQTTRRAHVTRDG
ncbi:MAG: hypothetical protein OXH52_03955 [Gammaproteobacteria bacterium]|nr:hypothetical protein [Gammaproteobacteria bacterium]